MGLSNSEINGILRRLSKAREVAREKDKIEDEPFYESTIDDFISSMCKYTKSAYTHEIARASSRNTSIQDSHDQKDFAEELQSLDYNRKLNHTSFLTNAILSCRICDQLGVERIIDIIPEKYINDSQNNSIDDMKNHSPELRQFRHAAAEWCFDLVIACSLDIDIDLNRNDYEGAQKISSSFNEKSAKDHLKKLTEPSR